MAGTSPIVKFGNAALKTPCEEVVFPKDDLKQIIYSMFLVMYKAKGVGLAANQLGLNERIAVIDIVGDEKADHQVILINPIIVESSGEIEMVEGCLSIPGINVPVKRFEKVKVETLDLEGKKKIIEADGLLARALQHEIDHLNGKLYIDHLHSVERMMLDGKLKQVIRDAKKAVKGIRI